MIHADDHSHIHHISDRSNGHNEPITQPKWKPHTHTELQFVDNAVNNAAAYKGLAFDAQ